MIQPICAECTKPLEVGRRPDAKYCNGTCANRAYRKRTERPKARECLWCQGPMDGKRWDARYCTKRCASLHDYYVKRNPARPERQCPTCGERFRDAHANRTYCSLACREVARRVRERGITIGTYREMLARQQHRCAICGVDAEGLWHGRAIRRDGWHIDHDHATGKVRGILCPPCNLILGYARDDVRVLAQAIAYLTP